MICWYCHWGWSKPVADIYDRHIKQAGKSAMHYGPAHIVWDDENFEREHVAWCLEHFDEYRGENQTDDELAAVRTSLEDMLALPDEIRDPCPLDYDNEYPERFPPYAGMEMVRR